VESPKLSFVRRLRPWLPAIAWAILISWASTDMFSASHTSKFIIPVLHGLFPRASAERLDRLHFFIRKSAHFTEYFVFSVLLLRALRGENRGWQIRWAIAALAIAAGYSALDEFHQSFVPSCTASPWDSLLDTSGALAAQIVLGLWACSHARRFLNGSNEGSSATQD
jgi:VanZ family protein